MPRNRVLAAAPGLPADIEVTVNRIMSLTPERQLELADRLERSGHEDLEQLAASIRRHVQEGEGEA